MNTRLVGALSLLLLVAVGCGGAPPPTARLGSSEAAIRAATEMGAPNEPKAALYLKLAQEQRDAAQSLIKEGKNHEAEMLLMKSEADAELALALAKAAATKAEAQKEIDQAKELKKKL